MEKPVFIADRYEILGKIGSGGMSDVYKAKDHKLNRFVAIKVLKPEFSEDRSFVTKFRVEAQSAAGLIHANIVNVYDVGDEDGIYYIVMELVEGITLKKYIEKKGRLGVREAVSIAIQVAQGIEAAHNHHIVHRDIKPQNIIISKEGKVKVTDFGIARAATSNTINSNAMGSVHYISPEQARGGYSDEKSDIYSFGIMLYEMLTGRVPFEGDTTVSVALQHIQDDIVSPAKLVPGIPVSVEKIVLKCTQKRTERRYQTMSDLIADLKHSLVAPNEDFVVMRPVASNGPTKMITEDELDMIHQMSSVKSTNISSRKKDSIYDNSDDEMDDEMDDDNDDVRNNHDLDYYDDDDDEDDYRPRRKPAKKASRYDDEDEEEEEERPRRKPAKKASRYDDDDDEEEEEKPRRKPAKKVRKPVSEEEEEEEEEEERPRKKTVKKPVKKAKKPVEEEEEEDFGEEEEEPAAAADEEDFLSW